MGNFHVKEMHFRVLNPCETVLVNMLTFVSLFSITLRFIEVDQMQGKEAGDNASTEVLV